LSRAAEKGNDSVVQLLIKYGTQPNLEDKEGQTPLSRAVEKGSAAVAQLLLIEGVEVDYNYRMVSKSNHL
jgi:ankyrin repeat protein